MNCEPDKNLERLIQEELQKLPDLQAPAILIPRVISRIRADALLTGVLAPWRNWSLPWKFISVLCFAVLLGVLAASLGGVNVPGWAENIRASTARLAEAWQTLVAALNAGAVVSRALSEHLLVWALLIFGSMAMVTIAAGTGLWRLTFSGQQEG